MSACTLAEDKYLSRDMNLVPLFVTLPHELHRPLGSAAKFGATAVACFFSPLQFVVHKTQRPISTLAHHPSSFVSQCSYYAVIREAHRPVHQSPRRLSCAQVVAHPSHLHQTIRPTHQVRTPLTSSFPQSLIFHQQTLPRKSSHPRRTF